MFPLGCGRWLADALLLHPTTGDLPAFGATEVRVPTPAGEAQVWVARSISAVGREPQRFVLVLVGNGGRAERYAVGRAARWGDVPAEVWAVNWPGFGGSGGRPTLRGLAPAAEAVYEVLHDRADGRPVFLDCDSMGTAVGLRLAAARRGDRPVAGLVLKNPPPLRQLVLGRFGWWNLWLAAGPVAAAVPAELDSVANAARCHAPALYLRAADDSLIPPPYQRRVSDAHAGRSRTLVLADADHNTPITAPQEAEVAAAIHDLFGRR